MGAAAVREDLMKDVMLYFARCNKAVNEVMHGIIRKNVENAGGGQASSLIADPGRTYRGFFLFGFSFSARASTSFFRLPRSSRNSSGVSVLIHCCPRGFMAAV